MSKFFEFVSNNALASTLVGTAIIGIIRSALQEVAGHERQQGNLLIYGRFSFENWLHIQNHSGHRFAYQAHGGASSYIVFPSPEHPEKRERTSVMDTRAVKLPYNPRKTEADWRSAE